MSGLSRELGGSSSVWSGHCMSEFFLRLMSVRGWGCLMNMMLLGLACCVCGQCLVVISGLSSRLVLVGLVDIVCMALIGLSQVVLMCAFPSKLT